MMIVAVIGVLKAGGLYVSLDGWIVTQSTLEHAIRDSRSVLILAPAQFHHRVRYMAVPVDDFAFRNDTAPHVKLQEFSHPSGEIYVIYMSGNALLDRHARYINATT